MTRRVDKPWGYEIVWAETERYAGKILHVEAGQRLSLQLHRVKDETLHVLGGRLLLVVDEDRGLVERELAPGQSYRIRPGVRHRLIGLTACDVLEASTPELDDVVRLEDSYGRAGTSAP